MNNWRFYWRGWRVWGWWVCDLSHPNIRRVGPFGFSRVGR